MPTYIVYYSQGNSNGPFNVYLSGSSGLNLYASNIPRSQLELGYTVTFPDGIPSSSVDVFDMAYGCFTEQNVPFPSVSPSVTPTPTRTPTITPSITVSPSITPSITVSPTVTPSLTPVPTSSPTLTPTPTPTKTSYASQTPTPTVTPTPSITRTPSPSPIPVYGLYGCSPGTPWTLGFQNITCYQGANGVLTQWVYLELDPSGFPYRAYKDSPIGLVPFTQPASTWYVFFTNGVTWLNHEAYMLSTTGYVGAVSGC